MFVKNLNEWLIMNGFGKLAEDLNGDDFIIMSSSDGELGDGINFLSHGKFEDYCDREANMDLSAFDDIYGYRTPSYDFQYQCLIDYMVQSKTNMIVEYSHHNLQLALYYPF